MSRWFLNALQKSVECLWGKTMTFIDQKNSIAPYCWGKAAALNQTAGIINPVIARCVNFRNIQAGAFIDGTTGLTLTAGMNSRFRTLGTV